VNGTTIGLSIQVVTLFASMATIASVFLALRVYRRQMNTQVFLAYTERYESIMNALSHEARIARLDSSAALPPESAELSLCVLRYLNLSSEEFYLCKSGYLDKKLWAIWEDELKRTLRSQLFRREWEVLRREFESYPEFQKLVGSTQGDRNAAFATTNVSVTLPLSMTAAAGVSDTVA
jgi:hypothetical protein